MSGTSNPHSGLTRRSFLKATGAAAGVLGLAGAGAMTATEGWLAPTQAHAEAEERVACTYHQNHCHGCCSLKCTVRDGRLCLIEPNDWKNDEYRSVCLKGLSEVQHVYSSERIQTPMKRVGERGSGEFVSITWAEAQKHLKEGLTQVWEKHGKESVLIPQALEPGNIFSAKLMGAQASGNIGIDIGWGNALASIIGPGALEVKSGWRDLIYSKTIINIGGNPLESRLVHGKHFFDAKEAGAYIISVDPHFSTTASKSNQWIPIKPGTDGALLLSMVSLVLENGWYDTDYVLANTGFPFLVDKRSGQLLRQSEERTKGQTGQENPYMVWDAVANSAKPYREAGVNPSLEGEFFVGGEECATVFSLLKSKEKDYSVAWAAEKTGVSQNVIFEATKRYATNGPAAINLGFGGPGKYSNADIIGHAAGILAALTGNVGIHGGGVGNIYPGKEPYGISLGAWSLPSEFKSAAKCDNVYDLPYKENNVHAAVFFSGVFVLRHGDLNAAKKWIKTLDYVAMTDIFFSPDTAFADLILPAASKFECSEEVGGIRVKGGRVMLQQGIVEPLFESKTDFEIERFIAETFGWEEYLPKTAEELVRKQLEGAKGLDGLTLEDMVANDGIYEVLNEIPPIDYENQEYKTSSGKLEPYVESMLGYGQALPSYENPDEVYEENPLREKYPLSFVQPRSKFHIHAQFCDAEWIKQYYEPTLDLNPVEMQKRGLAAGDVVEVFNDRGAFKCLVRASEAIRPGSASIIEGMWDKYLVEGSIQNVTNGMVNPRGYALPLGPVIPFNDTLVDVRKA